jgi:HEAT repeat protein
VTDQMPSAVLLPIEQVEELFRSLMKALRAFQMYLPNNPIYHRAADNIRAAFAPIWASGQERLVLQIVETDLLWEEQVVYHQPSKSESLAWSLFKDGMRVLTLHPGVENGEIVHFLDIVQRARTLPPDAGDDLLTLLWEQDFSLIQYHFTDFVPDAGVPGLSGDGAYSQPAEDPAAQAAENKSRVVEEAPQPSSGVIAVEDFDSTLYWLEEAEVRALAQAIDREYRQDLRRNVLNIVFDVLEQRQEDWVRFEILESLEAYLPHVLNAGDFRVVAHILREARLLGRRPDLMTPEQRARLEAFTGRLSESDVLTQILASVTEAQVPPSEDDLRELFGELRPAGLETVLVWLPRIPDSSPVHRLLSSAADRLAETSPQEVIRLLEHPESEALIAVIDLCARLRITSAVNALTGTMAHELPAVRAAAVRALEAFGTPGALQLLEAAIDDADREVRIAAAQAVARRGYKGVLERVEEVVRGKADRAMDLTERMRFFEAYAEVAGASSVDLLAELLSPGTFLRRKAPTETRACAALALGRLRTPEAREALERHRDDKELVVRNAVARALRETRS